MKNKSGTFKNSLVKGVGLADFGLVHTAIQIGPFILEWSTTEIVQITQSSDWTNQ